MNEYERYLFDLNGYLVVENVLSPEECQRLIDLLNQNDFSGKDNKTIHFFENGFMELEDDDFRKLINHPRLEPYLNEILGEDFRLDHEYGLSALKGASFLALHGGATPFDPAQYYVVRNNRIHCGLTAVQYVLTDVNLGEGGFCCLPGSHKANFPLPKSYVNFEETESLIQVPLKAGSALIFTEALTHGTLPYQGETERKCLFYKYSPANSSFSIPYRSEKLKSLCTPEQASRIEMPYVINRKRILRVLRRKMQLT